MARRIAIGALIALFALGLAGVAVAEDDYPKLDTLESAVAFLSAKLG